MHRLGAEWLSELGLAAVDKGFFPRQSQCRGIFLTKCGRPRQATSDLMALLLPSLLATLTWDGGALHHGRDVGDGA